MSSRPAETPQFESFGVKSENRRRLINFSFMAVCVVTSFVSLVVLVTLLSSIVAQGIFVLAPRSDSIIQTARIEIVQGTSSGNDPDRLDAGDIVRGSLLVDEIAVGGLGASNDVVFTDPGANETENGGSTPTAIVGFFAFEVGKVPSPPEADFFTLHPTRRPNQIAEFLVERSLPLDQFHLNANFQNQIENASIIFFQTFEPGLDHASLLDQLPVSADEFDVSQSSPEWELMLIGGQSTVDNFVQLMLDDDNLASIPEIKELLEEDPVGRWTGSFSVIGHRMGEPVRDRRRRRWSSQSDLS